MTTFTNSNVIYTCTYNSYQWKKQNHDTKVYVHVTDIGRKSIPMQTWGSTNVLVLVLKSALSRFFAVLEGTLEHLSVSSTCVHVYAIFIKSGNKHN